MRRLVPENVQGEYYLTDVIAVLRQAGHVVAGIEVDDPIEVVQVNDRAQLAAAEAELRARINDRWMQAGVTMVDPARTYIDATVELEADVRLLPGTLLEGRTVIGAGSVIGPDTQLVDTIVGRDAVIRQTGRVREPSSATTSPAARSCRCGRARGSPTTRTSARSSR